MFRVEQTYRRPSYLDPPGAAPPSLGRTLHHEFLDPLGDPISALRPMSSMGGPTSRDTQPQGLDLCHAHHLRGRRHCWEGCLPIHGRATAARRAAPCVASTLCSRPQWTPFTNGDPDDDVDPPLLPCHTWFLCQNQILIVCMTQDQLFHTYRPKVFTDSKMS
jgi:hypothetical protein